MFTGLTERVGTLRSLASHGGGATARIACAGLSGELSAGESISVDGACLTAVQRGPDWFEVEISPETMQRTCLGEKQPGARLNLERALRLADRLGGHLVQGHVDGVGMLTEVRPEGSGRRIRVSLPPGLERYLVSKGSIALDGVSLTVASLRGADFEVALIPHTLEQTTLGEWAAPRRLNVEVDLVAKYLESLLGPYAGATRQEGK
ncbi:MAG TPA: riboflavin synthase [Candidatus Polarisedimenticolia bacterium]|nr:riboflavin synthase [Candidatus Polarisedimenticolia bacterium]